VWYKESYVLIYPYVTIYPSTNFWVIWRRKVISAGSINGAEFAPLRYVLINEVGNERIPISRNFANFRRLLFRSLYRRNTVSLKYNITPYTKYVYIVTLSLVLSHGKYAIKFYLEKVLRKRYMTRSIRGRMQEISKREFSEKSGIFICRICCFYF